MKRLLFLFIFSSVLFFISSASAEAAANDFTITNYQIEYELGRDAAKHSRLTTTEKITAEFRIPNQNRGIERAIPTEFDGHKTNLKIISVTDEQNIPVQYTTYVSNGNTVVRIGNPAVFVLGTVNYVITYTQTDVTRYFSDVKRDEFYWDTNGTDWRVPISSLQVSLRIDDSIANAITGETACYQGVAGSNNRCILNRTNADFKTAVQQLGAGENVTLAVGFKPGTFTAYQPTILERLTKVWFVTIAASIPIVVGMIVFMTIRHIRWSRRSSERKIIVTEYLPPNDISVTTAATIINSSHSVFTAQLIDFAVRHYLKIHQTKEKSFLRRAEYDIEVVGDVTTLKTEEQEILRDIFGQLPKVGERLALKSLKNNSTVYSRMSNNDKQLQKLVQGEYGLREKVAAKRSWFRRIGLVSLGLAIVLLNVPFLILSIVAFIMMATLWTLTDKGLATARYLDGLKQYIGVAEVERLKQLQSPEGALKTGGINPDDSSQLVKLYEKVLPYAVLFGQEKEWNKQIGAYYESIGKSPDWYSGNNTVFNAAVFSSAMNSFGAAASYTSASSSSSGGSGGGGSSGGGGGGGGGGGW